MEIRFRDESYAWLEVDSYYRGGWPPDVVNRYRNRLKFIRDAKDEFDLYAWKSLRMTSLQGSRQHQHSLRLNDECSLEIELEMNSSVMTVTIVKIESTR